MPGNINRTKSATTLLRHLAPVLWILSGIVTAGLIVHLYWLQKEVLEVARKDARLSTEQMARTLDKRLRNLMPVAEKLANDLNTGALNPRDLGEALKDVLAKHPGIYTVGATYLPYALDSKTKLFGPQATRSTGAVELFQLEDRVDYTTYPWFQQAIKGTVGHWGEPYFGKATGTIVVSYYVPLRKPGEKNGPAIGVVRINLSMDNVRRLVSNISFGQTGYGFLLSSKGVYLVDPVEDYVHRQRTIFDVASEHNDEARRRLGTKAIAGEAAEEISVSGVTGQEVWIFSRPVPAASWSLAGAFIKDELALDPERLRQGIFRIALASMAFLFMTALIVFRSGEGTHRALWNLAIISAVLFVSGIGLAWWLTLTYPNRNGETSIHIGDEPSLQKFLSKRAQSHANLEEPGQVPTGVFLRTMHFGTANEVLITGYIWQVYDKLQGTNAPGFQLPDAETAEIKEAYRRDRSDGVVIGWNFKATFRQAFAGAVKYPFDRSVIRLRVMPRDLDLNVVLIPDFHAYQLMVPASLPGIEKGLVIPGWRLDQAYFSYVPTSYNTSFGLPRTVVRNRDFELSYNFVVQRRFLDPFISSVLPILVVVSLLFGLLMVCSKESGKVAATGFKATDVLRASIALLFPVLLAQVNLRSKISASTIIYIEYFYFVSYMAILGVAVNTLLFTLTGHGIAQIRDNIIPKLIFWPFVTGMCFVVTWIFLY